MLERVKFGLVKGENDVGWVKLCAILHEATMVHL